jgi:pyruvate kinase
MNPTKIVATIGPRTNTVEALRALHAAGVDMVRLNGAHGHWEWHSEAIALVRQTLPQVPILLDIPGRKIRLGPLPAPQPVAAGERLILVQEQRSTGSSEARPSSRSRRQSDVVAKIPVTSSDFHRDVTVGNRVLIDDTNVQLVVREVTDTSVICEVTVAGVLQGGKGVHFPGVTMRAALLRARDKKLLAFACRQRMDFVGLSFVATAQDIEEVRQLIGDKAPRIVAKVETQAAVENLRGILRAADGIMIDRGDLSAETRFDQVGILQKQILAAARQAACPVIVATEMLQTMIEFPSPTKAELCDITNAVLDGASALMLSGETAVGKYPVEAVTTMRRVADAAHAHLQTTLDGRPTPSGDNVPEAVGEAIAGLCRRLGVTKIVAVTKSGYAARVIAAHAPRQPIIAVSNDPEAARSFNLLQGTRGLHLDVPFSRTDTDHIPRCLEELWRRQEIVDDDLILVTAVSYPKSGNRMNLIQTHKVADLRDSLAWAGSTTQLNAA